VGDRLQKVSKLIAKEILSGFNGLHDDDNCHFFYRPQKYLRKYFRRSSFPPDKFTPAVGFVLV